MNLENFFKDFDSIFNEEERMTPECNGFSDPIPEIPEIMAPKVLWMLNLGFSYLNYDEAYLEIGCKTGKALVAALRYNDMRPIYVCDEYLDQREEYKFTDYMNRCRLTDQVFFSNIYHQDFFHTVKHKVGLFFCRGIKTANEQKNTLVLVEPHLACNALVCVDNWSLQTIRHGVYQAMEQTPESWKLIYELPCRFDNDAKMWWNGIALIQYEKQTGEKKL